MQKELSDIAKRIRDIRKVMGWKQRNLAEVAGVEWPQISAWENDRVTPPQSRLARIAKKLGQPVDKLFGEGEPMPSELVNRPVNRTSRVYPWNHHLGPTHATATADSSDLMIRAQIKEWEEQGNRCLEAARTLRRLLEGNGEGEAEEAT